MAPVTWPDGQSSITDSEAVYVVSLDDMTDGSNMIVTPAWCKESAIPHMWDRDIEAVLGKDRLAALRARCGAIRCDGALRCLTCEEVGLSDALHTYLDNDLYERILKQRIPGLRAFGDGPRRLARTARSGRGGHSDGLLCLLGTRQFGCLG